MVPNYDDLKQALNEDVLEALNQVFGEEAREALQHIRMLAYNFDKDMVEGIRQIYLELFIIPAPGRYIPPYGSCFREKDYAIGSGYGEISGATTILVEEFYRKNGFQPQMGDTPPDHIGIELLFVSKMCEQEAQAILKEKGRLSKHLQQQELEFLDEHLHNWLPDFVRKLMAAKDASFYPHLAKLTENFVEHDIKYLKSLSL